MKIDKIVLGTNVLFSSLYSSKGASYKILDFLTKDKFKLVVSIALVFEYEEVLKRNQRVLKLKGEDVDEILNFLCKVSSHQKVFYLWRPCLNDPKDDHLVELAVASKAEYIVTCNIKNFKGAQKFGITPIQPQYFLKQIGG